jgi:L-malate glycosyltransferase
MHLVIITSEELNEYDNYSSCFELAQAKALMKNGIDVSILSMGAITTKNILRVLARKLAKKRGKDLRLSGLSYGHLLSLAASTFFRSLLKKKKTRRLVIGGVTVYEALISKNKDFFVNHKMYEDCVEYGLKTIDDYINEKGKPDLVHAHSRFLLASLLALEIKKLHAVPYLITEHSTFYFRFPPDFLQKQQVCTTIDNASLLVTVSGKLGKLVNESLTKEYPYVVIPNIISEVFETNTLPKNRKPGSFRFLNVAALLPHKGHSTLLNAFAKAVQKNGDLVLRIVGNGEEMQKLKLQSKALGLEDKVVFLGQLPQESVREEMLAADCFVLSSEFETFGVVVIEAQACGKPVISTRCGGPEELIDDKNGMLVPVHDAESLAGAMMQVYNKQEVYNAELIRENCIRQYGQQAVAEKLISVYNTILDRRDNNN